MLLRHNSTQHIVQEQNYFTKYCVFIAKALDSDSKKGYNNCNGRNLQKHKIQEGR